MHLLDVKAGKFYIGPRALPPGIAGQYLRIEGRPYPSFLTASPILLTPSVISATEAA